MNHLYTKLRKYEIEIRKFVTRQMHGDYRSMFKGSGIEQEDVRAYQYGDDFRAINWKTSAKGQGTYINTYIEEKEQGIVFLLDVSASQNIGLSQATKKDIAKEITGVLMLSAGEIKSQVGLIGYSDQKEYFIPPAKGKNHIWQCISTLYHHQEFSKGTALDKGIAYTLQHTKQKSIIIIVSDFIDNHIQKALRTACQLHDVIAIHIHDILESSLPNLGLIPVQDLENGKTQWVNSAQHHMTGDTSISDVQNLVERNGGDFLSVSTQDDFVPQLLQLFSTRKMKSRFA